MRFAIAAVLAAGFAVRLASAQGSAPNPVAVTAFAGPSKVIGLTGDDLKWGYTAGGALDYRFAEARFGARAEVSYSSYAFNGRSHPGPGAKFTDTGVNLDAVSWAPTENSTDARAYVTLGPSVSRLTSVGASSEFTETHYGFNVGLGFDKPVGAFAYRVDVRFRQLSFNGDTFKSIPITVGWQF